MQAWLMCDLNKWIKQACSKPLNFFITFKIDMRQFHHLSRFATNMPWYDGPCTLGVCWTARRVEPERPADSAGRDKQKQTDTDKRVVQGSVDPGDCQQVAAELQHSLYCIVALFSHAVLSKHDWIVYSDSHNKYQISHPKLIQSATACLVCPAKFMSDQHSPQTVLSNPNRLVYLQ